MIDLSRSDKDDASGTMLTPMIDVVFQLIVFFMLTLRFKSVDERVQSELPRELGTHVSPTFVEPEPAVRVALGRPLDAAGKPGPTEVRLGRAVRLRLPSEEGPARLAALDQLTRVFSETRRQMGGLDRGELRTPGSAGSLVPHGDVVSVLDALLEAGVSDVRFEGAAAPR